MKNLLLPLLTFALLIGSAKSSSCQVFRSIDGYNNNLSYKDWGTAGSNQLNIGTIGFTEGYSTPAGQDWPNPRFISNSLFSQNTLANDVSNRSSYCWVWGQFIDHDITLVKDVESEELSIPIPLGDPYFDPTGSGGQTINMFRSEYDPTTGNDISKPREYVNHVTSYIDASAVYGSSEEHAAWLRTFTDGKLKVSSGNLLPWNTNTGEYESEIDPDAPEMAMPMPFVKKWFVAGDIRANENAFLTAMHTIFVREHNRLCEQLKTEHPEWTDEVLYQYARKIVGGIMQAIVYEEWLPQMGMKLPPYSGYHQTLNPGISNVFSAAAYRYGHTTINSILVRMDNEGNYLPQGDILLRDAFFNPDATRSIGGIEPYLIGMSTVVQQDFDCKLVDDLRNFLFRLPGEGGLDLAAINIERGRERGLGDYNSIRVDFGLEPLTDFSDLSSDPLMNQQMEYVYKDINKVDLWVAMLAENHMPGALFGNTSMTIIEDQFVALREGDRYYYEIDATLTSDEKEWIKNNTLAEVIRRNTDVTIIQDNIFIAQSITTAIQDGRANAGIDFALYPNPARDMIFLRIPSTISKDAIIQIFDLRGRELLQRDAQLSNGNNTLTLTLPPACVSGVYVLKISAEGSAGQVQFVVNK